MTTPGNPMDTEKPDLAARLMGIINSSWMSQAVCVAARLGIADHLTKGPQRADALATKIGCHAPSLNRLLRALVSLDVCRQREDERYELTPMGALLRTSTQNSLRAWAIWWGTYLWPVWGHLLHSITTGEPARSLVTGTPGFRPLENDAAMADTFNAAMVELTRLIAGTATDSYDFSPIRCIADIGGGYGELLATILKAHPAMRGILIDLPHALRGARQHLETAGVRDRCDIIAGDFFDSIPTGADAYLLKSIIHDWDDDRAGDILENCRRAMSPGARLLLVEHIMPERMEPTAFHQSLSRMDLNMLVAHGSRERTEAELRALLAAHRLSLRRIVHTRMNFAIIEATPN